MKDLKHLIFFENLLQEANNELIRQAKSEGKKCVAFVCENTPEPLFNLPGTFSVPERRPCSCPPPRMREETGAFSETMSAPTPFGPLNLCAARAR